MRFAAMVLAAALLHRRWRGRRAGRGGQTTFEVEQELLGLSNYGVFDFITFGVDRGTVMCGLLLQRRPQIAGGARGETCDRHRQCEKTRSKNCRLRRDEDRIRWATFYKIYGDDLLSWYAPEGEMGVRYELQRSRQFPGMQPFGTYPIHIIVKNGRTTLMGVVDSQADKTVAEIRAREVSGVFSIENVAGCRRRVTLPGASPAALCRRAACLGTTTAILRPDARERTLRTGTMRTP